MPASATEPDVRLCPVCLLHVRVTATVWTHLDTAGNRCVMSGQAPVESAFGGGCTP